MKERGIGKNRFGNDLLRQYYDEIQQCFLCGQYRGSDFHHNTHRHYPEDASLLNAVPLCRECHTNDGAITKLEQQQVFFERVLRHLFSQGYKLQEIDMLYLRRYSDKFYQIMIKFLNK